MYPVSATFKDYIKRNDVFYTWHGTIVDLNGNSYNLTNENIVQNAGKITKKCSSDKLQIGTTCASELEMNLFLDVDRYTLFDATVTLYFTLYEGVDANDDPITEDVPMGIFTIAECNQSNGQLNFIAYDAMVKFDDVNFSAALNKEIKSPYNWLLSACTACGVVLGVSASEVARLPNGSRNTGFADCVSDAKTWRDVLGYMCTALNSFAYIGRDGKLYLQQYGTTSIDTITASNRFSSELSDYRTTYDGLYAIYKASGTQEYVDNQNTNGLILDIGTNPFLQFTDNNSRLQALQEIIDAWNGVYYVPYKSEIPIMPHYDLADVLTFTGNQASTHDIGALTEIIYSIGGKMSIVCSGDNPRLADAQDRFSKTVEGLSSEYSNGQEIGGKNFWMLISDNTSDVVATSTKTQVAEIEWTQSTDIQKIGMMYTCEAVVSATAVVSLELSVDDEANYKFITDEEKLMLGKRRISANCGFKVEGKGQHTAKVYMIVTDSPLLWGDLA